MIPFKPTLSKSPTPAKNVRQLGMPVRGPPKVSPSMLYSYSDTFEDSLSPRVVQYSDTIEEISSPKFTQYSDTFEDTAGPKDSHDQHTDTFEETSRVRHYSDTFESEAPNSYSDTFIDGTLATEKIDTFISEASDSHMRRTDSSHPYSYSETFESGSSPHHNEDSATYRTDSHINETSRQYSHDSYTYSESVESKSKYGGMYSPSGSEDETYSERQAGDSDEDQTLGTDTYDYSYTFEEADTTRTEDPEKLRKEAELLRLTEEARENFAADILSLLRQKHIRESEISVLLRPEKKEKGDTLDWHTARFVKKKLRMLKEKKSGVTKKSQTKKSSPVKSKQPGELIQDYGLDPAVLERIKLKNFMKNLEMAANQDIHDPRHCKECRAHQLKIDAAAAQRHFVREKTRHVRQEIIDDRIQKHLVKMGSLSLIGELARTLPKPTEDPEDILERLNKGPLLSKSISQTRKC